jgi:hypothetical protein
LVEIKEETRRKEKDGKRIRDHAVEAVEGRGFAHRMRECGAEDKIAKTEEE